MLPASLFFEILVALLTGTVVLLLWRTGRRERLAEDKGWWPVLIGFVLIFFGSLIDISDHFPSLSRFLILGQTPVQSIAEKMLGFFGGFLLLAVGLFRWLPYVAARRRKEESLRSKNEDLEEQLRQGSKELQLNRLQSEAKVRRHQRRARQTENLVEAVASGAPIALIATGPGGRVSVAAGRALDTLGIPEDASGQSLTSLLPRIAEPLSLAMEGKTITTSFQSGNLTFQARCSPWLADDRQIGAVVIATDITDLIQAQDGLRQARDAAEAASRAKSDFLASMSHELRTPLNSVIGFANLLEKNKGGRLSPQDLKFLDRISDNGKHLLTLINEILDLSKIEAGHMEIVRKPVSLRQLIQDVASQMAPQAREGVRLGIKLDMSFEDDPTTNQITTDAMGSEESQSGTLSSASIESLTQEISTRGARRAETIETDYSRLRQILVNLTANALKFTHEGKVTIRLHQSEQGAPEAISVTDTGIGIPQDHLGSIFEAFQQVDSGTTRHYTGTGLGLSITRSLCDLLGFALTVESEVNKGSTFKVWLTPYQSSSPS